MKNTTDSQMQNLLSSENNNEEEEDAVFNFVDEDEDTEDGPTLSLPSMTTDSNQDDDEEDLGDADSLLASPPDVSLPGLVFDETRQLGGEAAAGAGRGLYESTYGLSLETPGLLGIVQNVDEHVADWSSWAYESAEARAKETIFNIARPWAEHVNGIETPTWELHESPVSAFGQLAWKNRYRKLAGDEFIKDFEKTVRISDKERGFLDRAAYWTTSFAGEMVTMPIGAQAFSRARKALDMRPKERKVKQLHDEITAGNKTLGEIEDKELQAMVRRAVFSDVKDASQKVLSFRDKAYVTLKASGLHLRDSLNYGSGAGLAALTAFGSMRLMDFSEEEANDMAPLFGLIGMFTGIRPFKKAVGLAATPITGVGRIPIPLAKNLTVGDLTMKPLKLRFLINHHRYLKQGNITKANENMLRYSGASKEEAMLLADNSQESQRYLRKKVDKQVIDDAVSFHSMLENLLIKHPEYYEHIKQSRDRALKIQNNFKDVFVNNPEQNDRLKQVFREKLTERNKLSGTYNDKQLEEVIKAIDVGDVEVLLDQIIMVDFLSSIRNMAMSQTTLKSLSSKETIDLYTEAFGYNKALQGQVDITKAALESLMLVRNPSTQTKQFFENISKTYDGYVDDIKVAGVTIKQKLEETVSKQQTLNDNKFLEMVQRIGKPSRFDNAPSPVDAEEEFFDSMQSIMYRIKDEKMDGFTNEYEGLYYDVDIPKNATATQREEIIRNAPKVEMDASELMIHLDDLDVQEASAATLGAMGRSETSNILGSKLDSFKAKLRSDGIKRRFNTRDFDTSDPDALKKEMVIINRATEELYDSLRSQDPNFFTNNKTLNMQETPIEEAFRGTYDSNEEMLSALIDAAQKQTEDIANLNVSGAINSVELNKTLDNFTQPRITVEDAHSIIKDLKRKARNTNDPSRKREIRMVHDQFLEGMNRSIKNVTGDSQTVNTLKNIGERYNKEIIEVYRMGNGKRLHDHYNASRRQVQIDPLRLIYEKFITDKNPALAARQFKKMFPEGEARDKAVDALKYALSVSLENGDKTIQRLSGANFKNFKNAFKDILGEDTIKDLDRLHEHVTVGKANREAEIKKAEEAFESAVKNLSKESMDRLSNSIVGKISGEAAELSAKDITNAIFGRTQYVAAVRSESEFIDASEQILKTEGGKLGLDASDVSSVIDDVQLPKRDVKRQQLRGDIVSLLIEESPELKQPIKDMMLQHLIEESFTVTPTKRFDPQSKTIMLDEHINITEFSNIFQKNIDVFERVFEPKEMETIQSLFEGGVLTAGKNYALRLMNLAAEATTSSRASRLFALQRQVVGMPYLATEQAVMAFQRDKAAFLKRIVLDPEFAKLLETMAIKGEVTQSNVAKYVNYLKTAYNTYTFEEEDIDDIKQRFETEYQTYNNSKNQKGEIVLPVKPEQIAGDEARIANEVKEKYGLGVKILGELTPIVAFITEGFGGFSDEDKKALSEAAEMSKKLDEKRFRDERSREAILGSGTPSGPRINVQGLY